MPDTNPDILFIKFSSGLQKCIHIHFPFGSTLKSHKIGKVGITILFYTWKKWGSACEKTVVQCQLTNKL